MARAACSTPVVAESVRCSPAPSTTSSRTRPPGAPAAVACSTSRSARSTRSWPACLRAAGRGAGRCPDLPAELWELLAARRPVALITELDGDQVAGTTLVTPETVESIEGAGEEIVSASPVGRATPS